ncbi:MAG: diguanylate cyclase [Phycisphaerae bacterium]|nr:diguanylate cyclase [Phycisphaerae bacterium]
MSDPKRVLVVDGDATALASLRDELSAGGYDVLAATNAADALRTLLADGPRIVITDWSTSRSHERDLCRAIREHEGAGFVHVLVLTDAGNERHVIEAFDAGANDVMSKPARRGELLARVRAGERIIQLETDLARTTREVALQNARLAIVNEKLNHAASTDELTGLGNRRDAMARLSECWALSDRQGSHLAVMLLDIDHFKKVNDTFGHDGGDEALRGIADRLRQLCRIGEAVYRVGGEEFLVLCPGVAMEQAAQAAERLRRAIEQTEIPYQAHVLRPTVSVGVAERTAAMKDFNDLYTAADAALYGAKRSGRNRVMIHGRDATLVDASSATRGLDLDRLARQNLLPPEGRILIFDHDGSIERLCRTCFGQSGMEICVAGREADARRLAAEFLPDVVLLDVGRADGLEIARQLRQNAETRDVPIVIFNTRSSDDDLLEGFSAGADDYLAKPPRPMEFVLRVGTMVRLHVARRELTESNEFRGEQARALNILLEYSHTLAAMDSLDEVLERTIQTTALLARCRRISIMMPDAERRRLRVARSIGIADELKDRIAVRFGEATAGRVFATQETVVVNDAPSETTAKPGAYPSPYYASMPLVSHALGMSGTAIGVLNVTGRIGNEPFTPLELECIDMISHIAASAIQGLLTRKARDEARNSIVVALAKLAERRDQDTGEHVERVTRFCVILAEELRSRCRFNEVIDDAFIANLRRAVPLHDIGKVGIPDRILLKSERLTPEEMRVMRTHCQIGADCLRSVLEKNSGAAFLRMAVTIAESHHEWFDGSGYPEGLTREEIPLEARIAALADVYDALRTRRPYKEAMSHAAARDIILRGAGAQFDPAVVEAFFAREAEFERLAADLPEPDEPPPEPPSAMPIQRYSGAAESAAPTRA